MVARLDVEAIEHPEISVTHDFHQPQERKADRHTDTAEHLTQKFAQAHVLGLGNSAGLVGRRFLHQIFSLWCGPMRSQAAQLEQPALSS
jgi:hypothetical protein